MELFEIGSADSIANGRFMMSTAGKSQGFGTIGVSRLQRLMLAGTGFIAFETLFIWLLVDKVYDFSYFSPVLWGMLALAGTGYFALGYCSRSWWSGLILAAPLLVAVYFVNVVWTTEYGNGVIIGENANFAEIWLSLSFIFVPAWAIGVLSANRRLGDR